ncbi:V-type ATP synthase subunit D [Clostridium polyendosporum]|uniref:V-type ATP synthase subunit D n=1 Tax=Clostridium polyendosporum TaxID=69208 RepID=A0A919RXQ4_9CLOT|nr:V-type ATP synthase subunit D [Clostridium polyendosporum]GIM27463.1 V-type ATP synthase subunit D [Clostridium polyendosporum]
MENLAPTKANLMASKSSLEFSKKGYELLDKKRNVLIKEMLLYLERVKTLQEEMNTAFANAYQVLQRASITSGMSTVEDISLSVGEADDYFIRFRSVMGVELPEIVYKSVPVKPTYSFFTSNGTIDEAILIFNRVKYIIYELSEVENSIYRLAVEVKKTQRRANALENISIPKYMEIVKFISEVLEEKEREDLFRLKKVKKRRLVKI